MARESEFGGDGKGFESYTTNDLSTRTHWAVMGTNPADPTSGSDVETSKAQ